MEVNKMGELLYARLDPQLPGEEPLLKRLDNVYRTKTYGQLAEKLLDPQGDAINEEYTAAEKAVVTRLEGVQNPSIVVYTKSGSEKDVNPNDSIQNDLDEILAEEPIVNDNGEQVKVPIITFTIQGNTVGGYL